MVKSGHLEIRAVDFQSALGPALPVEVLDRVELLDRVGPAHFALPQRPTFPQFVLMRSEGGAHVVDFEPISARPGRLIHTRPGQVQLWDASARFDATLVIAEPASAAETSWFPGHRPWMDLDPADLELVTRTIAAIRRLHDPHDGEATTGRLMLALFEVLRAVFERAAHQDDRTRLPAPYVAFRDAIERDLTHALDVTDHARRLGYSARTLSRACRQVTGQTAKAVLTERVALEAKRLLVHTDLTAAAVGDRLGFSEATNFSKFFGRTVGTSPTKFRARYRDAVA